MIPLTMQMKIPPKGLLKTCKLFWPKVISFRGITNIKDIRYVPYSRRGQEPSDSGLDCIGCTESFVWRLRRQHSRNLPDVEVHPWEIFGDYPSHTRVLYKAYSQFLRLENEGRSIVATSIVKYPRQYLQFLQEMLGATDDAEN